MEILRYILFAAIGGLATSLTEYFLKYNLIDFLKDKIVGLFTKKKAAT